ncbi:MAG: hypothetical protein ACREH5_04225, partial [Candidatus Omnitrophota bacterium]
MRHPLLKSISLLLAAAFLLQDLSFAAQFEFTPRDVVHDPALLKIASSAGRVREIHRGSQPKLLIHIQDAHANPSAQENVAKVLEELIQRYDLKTVFVEGGTKNNSLASLRPFAPREFRERVAKKYLLRGELNGDEYLSLASDHDLDLWGVEEAPLYQKNLKSYANVVSEREAVLAYLGEIEKRVEILKRRFYPKGIVALDDFLRKFENREKEFTDYYARLTDAASRHGIDLLGFPHFLALRDLRSIEEKIDFDKANEENQKLLRLLFPEGSEGFEGVSRAGASPAKLRSQFHTPCSFYEALLEEAKKRGLPPADRENLVRYADYLRFYERIDLEKLLAEASELERGIYRKSLASPDALYLYEIARHLKSLKELFSLRISKENFDSYFQGRKDIRFQPVTFLAFLNKKLYELGNVSDVIRYLPLVEDGRKEAEDFYKTTEARDEVFIRKALAKMDQDRIGLAVLITGGYHTPHLKSLMDQRGVSYAVVTPRVTSETDHERYEKILLAQLGREFPDRVVQGRAGHMRYTAERSYGSPIPRIQSELSAWNGPKGARLAQHAFSDNARRMTGVLRGIVENPDYGAFISGLDELAFLAYHRARYKEDEKIWTEPDEARYARIFQDHQTQFALYGRKYLKALDELDSVLTTYYSSEQAVHFRDHRYLADELYKILESIRLWRPEAEKYRKTKGMEPAYDALWALLSNRAGYLMSEMRETIDALRAAEDRTVKAAGYFTGGAGRSLKVRVDGLAERLIRKRYSKVSPERTQKILYGVFYDLIADKGKIEFVLDKASQWENEGRNPFLILDFVLSRVGGVQISPTLGALKKNAEAVERSMEHIRKELDDLKLSEDDAATVLFEAAYAHHSKSPESFLRNLSLLNDFVSRLASVRGFSRSVAPGIVMLSQKMMDMSYTMGRIGGDYEIQFTRATKENPKASIALVHKKASGARLADETPVFGHQYADDLRKMPGELWDRAREFTEGKLPADWKEGDLEENRLSFEQIKEQKLRQLGILDTEYHSFLALPETERFLETLDEKAYLEFLRSQQRLNISGKKLFLELLYRQKFNDLLEKIKKI